MDIYLSTNDRGQLLRLPVVPDEVGIKQSNKNETFSTISLGDIKLLGLPELAAISLSKFFPNHDYPFVHGSRLGAWEYVNTINAWRTQRTPVRCIVTGADINLLCGIDSFEYSVKDGSGDVYYTLELSEFRLVKVG